LGATVIKEDGWVKFVNLREMYWSGGEKIYRKKLKKILKTRKKDLQPTVPQTQPVVAQTQPEIL
jgi:hypothetical protein